MKLLIKNCNLISVDSNRDKYEEGIDILIENDIIKKIGKNIDENVEKVIDATNKVVMPGFINTHAHVPMSIFKENLDGYTLQEWLTQKIWPAEAKLTDEDIYNASILSFKEMIDTGTTTIVDMYFMQNNIIKAAVDSGVRIELTRTLMDSDGEGDRKLKELEELINSDIGRNENVTINVGAHALYTCSEEYLKKAIDLANKYNLNFQMHFCENSQEVLDIKRDYNVNNPADVLEKHLKNTNSILAHCVKLTDKDIEKMKELNISVAHCPVSNLKLGCGIARINDLQEAGINVALGTDGQGSGSSLDMFEVMKFTALLQKGVNENPKQMPAYEVIKMATINGAKALRMEDKIGSIAEGKKADLIILNLDTSVVNPINDIFASIVYNTKGSNVETTIINGKILK
ncbi:MAG: amidohydrolase [Clostridia bacterium]|nr:amidohydrolase [Clostridia bacterium]